MKRHARWGIVMIVGLLAAGAGGHAAIWDLRAFDRHIAGNLEYEMARLREELGDAIQTDALRAWKEDVLARDVR